VTDLKALAAAVLEDGWASGQGDVDSVRRQAASLGWAEVAPRRGDPAVSLLRPAGAGAAHPRSLSAVYGLGQQPLHTDGAHLSAPPDFIVLISQEPSATPTRLWQGGKSHSGRTGMPLDAMQHGMFLVRNGRDSFYAPALSGSRYRYDPGCMTACDARAREAAQYLDQQHAEATSHEWAGGEVLVVDNRHALHARAAVAEGDLGRELARVAFRAEAVR
jgi:Taurine catabolism dioxygenase TauD, TfdA family